MSQDNQSNNPQSENQDPTQTLPAEEAAVKKKRKLSLDIDQVDISEKLERKISA
jgi:hypothetical protein